MRALKFMTWDEQSKQMISPDYITRSECAFWKENSIPTFSKVIIQYTGLKDKKANRDVYEHDIYFEIDGSREVVFVITWINERAAFAMLEVTEYSLYMNDGFNAIERDFDGFYFEVAQDSIDKMTYAGNIYQNPELL